MACERYGEALVNMAAGLPAPAGLEAHLASCEACRAELQVLQQALAVADAEMAGLLAAEPAPELAVRIRQAVAETRELSPHLAGIRQVVAERRELSPHLPAGIRQGVAEFGLSPAWRFGWLWPATAAAATLLVAVAAFSVRGTPSAPEPRVAVDASRPQSVDASRPQSAGTTRAAVAVGEPVAPADRPVPGADPQLPVPQGSRSSSRGAPFESGDEGSAGVVASPAAGSNRAPAHSRTAGRRVIPAEPEVLVPPGEAGALLRFAAQLQRRAVAPDSLLVADLTAPLADPRAVDIAPLEIIPLDPTETSGTD